LTFVHRANVFCNEPDSVDESDGAPALRGPARLVASPILGGARFMNALERRRLQETHRRLNDEIARRLRGRWADPLELQRLKKKKLAIKDWLHRIASDHKATQAA
jgi:hypothetical protein